MKDKKGMMKLRAEVITRTIDLEMMINAIITYYFFPDKKEYEKYLSFRKNILLKEFFSLSRKIEIINVIITEKELKKEYEKLPKKLSRIAEIRNDFAHLPMVEVIPDFPEKIERKIHLIDLTKEDIEKSSIDVKRRFEEFIALEVEVMSQLVGLAEKIKL